MSVAENIFLGDEPKRGPFKDTGAMQKRARELFQELEFSIDPDAMVTRLSRAEQQMVEIAKALGADAKVLIMDEPTASLPEHEVRNLFRVVKDLEDRRNQDRKTKEEKDAQELEKVKKEFGFA